ncbi:putative phage abortive infection protein [Pseudoalteromonas sp. ASV78]|uniref:putative phage abortive infection protein n=1 Tax=Pseudoalteromonas sp. ASV78 TaxID=3397851 RepID=UPI0039FC6ECB
MNSYLRVAYQVLKFVDENCPDDKRKYSRIFRSFLSNELVFLLALNSAKRNEEESFKFLKYKRLIERYEILEHLYISFESEDINDFIRSNNYLIFVRFNKSAFGDCVNYMKFIDTSLKYYISHVNYLLNECKNKHKKHEELNELFLNYDGYLSSIEKSYNQGLPFSSTQNDYNNKLKDLISRYLSINIGDDVYENHVKRFVEYREVILEVTKSNFGIFEKSYSKLKIFNDDLSKVFTECNEVISQEETQKYPDLKRRISLEINKFNDISEHTCD